VKERKIWKIGRGGGKEVEEEMKIWRIGRGEGK
jgi:hypothetical protein